MGGNAENGNNAPAAQTDSVSQAPFKQRDWGRAGTWRRSLSASGPPSTVRASALTLRCHERQLEQFHAPTTTRFFLFYQLFVSRASSHLFRTLHPLACPRFSHPPSSTVLFQLGQPATSVLALTCSTLPYPPSAMGPSRPSNMVRRLNLQSVNEQQALNLGVSELKMTIALQIFVFESDMTSIEMRNVLSILGLAPHHP